MSKSNDLTISEALRDPLIAMVMRADGVTLEDFKQLLETAARKPGIEGGQLYQRDRQPQRHKPRDSLRLLL